MDVRNCKICGRIFNHIQGGPTICEICSRKMEDKFQEVKKYIYDNPHSTINDVAKANDVSAQQIRKWIREERLEFSNTDGVGIECEKCGRPITTGRFCNICKSHMANEFGNAIRTNEPVRKKKTSDKDKMRFLDA